MTETGDAKLRAVEGKFSGVLTSMTSRSGDSDADMCEMDMRLAIQVANGKFATSHIIHDLSLITS